MESVKEEPEEYDYDLEVYEEKRSSKRIRPDPMANSCVYTIWNTKGGVGKSTLTFHIASQFAKTHPERRILIVDMCPQANVSTALLGASGDPVSSRLETIRNNLVVEQSDEEEEAKYFKSISGILLMRIQNIVQDWDPSKYLVKISDHNTKMPSNMYLLVGDATLELMGKEIEKYRNGPRTLRDPWKEGTLIVRKIIERLSSKYREIDVGLTVFIDTNPAFSVYTETAVAAADRLIIPINADDFSNAACKSMLGCVYGGIFDSSYEHEMLRHMKKEVFAYRAVEAGLSLPKIHLIINNRVTIYGLRASKAFKVMGNVILKRLWRACKQRPDIFSEKALNVMRILREDPERAEKLFGEHFHKELNDFHQTAVQSIHSGAPLYSLNFGPSTTQIGEVKAPINKVTLEGYRRKLEEIVRMID